MSEAREKALAKIDIRKAKEQGLLNGSMDMDDGRSMGGQSMVSAGGSHASLHTNSRASRALQMRSTQGPLCLDSPDRDRDNTYNNSSSSPALFSPVKASRTSQMGVTGPTSLSSGPMNQGMSMSMGGSSMGKGRSSTDLGMSMGNGGGTNASTQDSLQVSLSIRWKGLLLYGGGVLFHVEWCIRQTALVFFYHTL